MVLRHVGNALLDKRILSRRSFLDLTAVDEYHRSAVVVEKGRAARVKRRQIFVGEVQLKAVLERGKLTSENLSRPRVFLFRVVSETAYLPFYHVPQLFTLLRTYHKLSHGRENKSLRRIFRESLRIRGKISHSVNLVSEKLYSHGT